MKLASVPTCLAFGLLAALMVACGKSDDQPDAGSGAAPGGGAVGKGPGRPEGGANALDDGCWVHIYEDENFGDTNDIIRGPGKWPNMRGLPGAARGDWGDDIDSIKTGPRARFTGWEDEGYGDNRIDIEPNQNRNNLRGNPDMGDQIDSMEIACS